jgi:hypothetical protein
MKTGSKSHNGDKVYKSLFCEHGKLLSNKYWEIEGIKDPQILLKLEVDISLYGKDHAGLVFGFGILGYEISFRAYDSRHWDYETGQWEIHKKQENPKTGNPPL